VFVFAGFLPINSWTWLLLWMYLLNRLSANGSERKRDEDGFEAGGCTHANGCALILFFAILQLALACVPGTASKPSYGYSLVQGRRPYMEDFIYSSLQYGDKKVRVHVDVVEYCRSARTCICTLVCPSRSSLDTERSVALPFCVQDSCFFGCFDGHCGKQAAIWAKEYLYGPCLSQGSRRQGRPSPFLLLDRLSFLGVS
jgi:hypothetical protein